MLNISDIKKYSSKEILEFTLTDIDSIYRDFQYMGISKKEFYSLVLEQINKSKNDYDNESDYCDFLFVKIKEELFRQARNRLKNPDKR